MKKAFFLFLILSFAPWTWASTIGGQVSVAQTGPSDVGCVGFAPAPCARTDLGLQSVSLLPFANTAGGGTGSGGYASFPANTIYVDNDFGERNLRVTDQNTLPTCFGSSTQNTNIFTSFNPSDHIWSSDDNYFVLVDNNTHNWAFSFNPSTFQVTCLPWHGNSSSLFQMPWGHSVFGRSAADAGLVFGFGNDGGTSVPSYQLRWTNITQNSSSTPTITLMKDLSTCSGLGFLANAGYPANKAVGGQGTTINTDLKDQYVAWLGSSNQNEGWLTVVYYNPNGLTSASATGAGCYWIDQRTGQYGGDFTSGQVTSMPATFATSTSAGSPPTAQGTTGGSITTGHTIDVAFTLVFDCFASASSPYCTQNFVGVGESALTTIQRVTLGGGNTAVTGSATIAAFPTSAQPDTISYSHYNVYAQDEANCSNALCPASSLVLQPASNFTGGLTAPTCTATSNAGSGTTWTYTVTAVSLHYTLWGTCSVSGGSTPNNTVTITAAATGDSGNYHYQIIRGPAGSSTTWTQGTASCDPIAGGSTCYTAYGPALADDVGANPGIPFTYTDTLGFADLAATGTISGGTAFTLSSLTTSGTPPPLYGTLGIFAHSLAMDLQGKNVVWGSVATVNAGIWFWQIGTGTVTPGNTTATAETLPFSFTSAASSYTSSNGHAVMAYNGITNNNAAPNSVDVNYDLPWRPLNNYRSLAPNNSWCVTDGSYPNNTLACRMIGPTSSAFPATVSPQDFIDQHPSYNTIRSPGPDLNYNFFESTDPAGSASTQNPVQPRRAWEYEVLEFNPTSGTMYRLGHHQATGVAAYIATCSVSPHCETTISKNSLMDESDDGKYMLYTSDMGWLLGCEQSSSCTYGTGAVPNTVLTGVSLGSVFLLEGK